MCRGEKPGEEKGIEEGREGKETGRGVVGKGKMKEGNKSSKMGDGGREKSG